MLFSTKAILTLSMKAILVLLTANVCLLHEVQSEGLPALFSVNAAFYGLGQHACKTAAAKLNLDADSTRISFSRNLKTPYEREVSFIDAKTIPDMKKRLKKLEKGLNNITTQVNGVVSRVDTLEEKGSKRWNYQDIELPGFGSWSQVGNSVVSRYTKNITVASNASLSGAALFGIDVKKGEQYVWEVTGLCPSVNAVLYVASASGNIVLPGRVLNAEIGTISNTFVATEDVVTLGVVFQSPGTLSTFAVTDYKVKKVDNTGNH